MPGIPSVVGLSGRRFAITYRALLLVELQPVRVFIPALIYIALGLSKGFHDSGVLFLLTISGSSVASARLLALGSQRPTRCESASGWALLRR